MIHQTPQADRVKQQLRDSLRARRCIPESPRFRNTSMYTRVATAISLSTSLIIMSFVKCYDFRFQNITGSCLKEYGVV